METATSQTTGSATTISSEDNTASNLINAGAVLGLAWGVFYAFKTGGGFWRYIGYALLFNFLGWSVGAGAGYVMKAIKK